jgi:hypothetical protein
VTTISDVNIAKMHWNDLMKLPDMHFINAQIISMFCSDCGAKMSAAQLQEVLVEKLELQPDKVIRLMLCFSQS